MKSVQVALLTGFLLTASYAVNAAVITTGLVGYWSGDGNTNDASGMGNHGTLQGGVSYTEGVFGQAFALDGVSGYVSTNQTFADDQSHTISAWVNWRGHTNYFFQEIVSWWDLSISPVDSRTFLGAAQGGQGPMRYGDAWTDVNATIPLNEWVHVLATYDGTDNSRNIYLNGILIDSILNSQTAKFHTLSIGRQGSLDSEYWNGAIDELALYDRVLSAAEIATMSAVPVPPAVWLFTSGLLGLVGVARRRA